MATIGQPVDLDFKVSDVELEKTNAIAQPVHTQANSLREGIP